MKERPLWTVIYNTNPTSKWIGTGWEFFEKEKHAHEAYLKHKELGNSPTMRPYYPDDDKYLGVIHLLQDSK